MVVFKELRGVVLLAVLCVSASAGARAQASSSGSIAGSVVGPDGKPVSAAALTLHGMDAADMIGTAAADGTFLLQDMPSGGYMLRVSASGFAPNETPNVPVAVGRVTRVTVRMALAGDQQAVSVTGAQTSFDPEQTSSVVNIDRDRVEELPIPSRNYLTFVLLSPQVMAANPAATQGLPQSSSGFSFGGLRPGSNAVYIDGVNDDDAFNGGSRTQLSPEAISDFQIVNHGFAAESGGGAGGSIDVQTRRGVNRFHGDAFLFVQNGALNATPPLERAPRKPDESRLRAGTSLGGQIGHDRTYYFVAAEQELARGEEANDLQPATLAAINNAVRGYAPLNGLQLQSGFFATTDQETEASGRVDRALTANESLMLRYALTNGRNVNDAFNTDDLTDVSGRGSSFVDDNSLNGTLTSVPRSDLLNAASFELAQRRVVDRTVSASGPGVVVAGVVNFGTPRTGNDRHFETQVEAADALTVQQHKHLLRFGGRFDHVAERAATPEGAQGTFAFADLAALQAGTADTFTQSFGGFNTNFAAIRIAAFAQDHWTPTEKLAVDAGVRYEVNRLPSQLPQDAINFSPRLGLAWTPLHALVVRGGFGIFFDRFELGTINRVLEFDGSQATQQIVDGAAATTVYQSGSTLAAPLAGVAPSVWRAQPGLRNPYSEVGSLSVERELPLQTTLTAEYQFVHGVRLGRSSNVNLTPSVNGVFTAARANAAYDAVNQFATEASSTYNGGTLTVNRQFQDDLQIMAGYTYSKTLDDASYDGEQPQNPFDLRPERALSLQDQRQRFTLSGLWLIGPDLGDPADAVKNANPGPWMKALTGFEFAPIVSLASGFRENAITGLDSNLEHIYYPFAARPAGYGRNALATPAQLNVDLRVLRMVALGPGHLDIVAESFNIINHRNVTLLNTAFGAGATPLSSFTQPIATGDARRIQFSLDYEF